MLTIKRKEPPKAKEPVQYIKLSGYYPGDFSLGFKIVCGKLSAVLPSYGSMAKIDDPHIGGSFHVSPKDVREFAKALLEMADQAEGITHEED